MTLYALLAVALVLLLAGAVAWLRRVDLHHQREAVRERAAYGSEPATSAPLQVPVIDLARCLGCGTCVRECPESGVLALVHGQAAVVNAAACVGHARCVSECPVGAVTLSSGDLSSRRDVPVLDDELQAVGSDGLFLVGEITARALIRVATQQGVAAAQAIARRVKSAPRTDAEVLDAVIVGAGPGGFACALACSELGLRFSLLDQERTLGGTVAKYPRRKLVLTDEVALPLHGRLPRREYQKEELVALWHQLAKEHRLPFRGGVTFDRVERRDDGSFLVHTDAGVLTARNVVLAVGRRGMPRRLDVPGEDSPHVTYSLVDAEAFHDCHLVVVGGGDSAIEAALALAEQPGNTVTIVHRRDRFARLRKKNQDRVQAKIADGRIDVLYEAEVAAIGDGHVELVRKEHGAGGVKVQTRADHVFVMVGGVPPFAQLEQSGVSFDPAMRPEPAPAAAATGGDGIFWALSITAVMALLTVGFVWWHRDYYLLATAVRAADPLHAVLRPDRSLGLWLGLGAAAAVVVNLAYLMRRQQLLGTRWGSLSAWMNVHVVAGVAAALAATLHAALQPRATPGGYAFWALFVLLVTGAIGRWFYAWLPRATNGRELELDALRRELSAEGADRRAAPFEVSARAEVMSLLDRRQWRSTWIGRVVAMIGLRWDLWLTLRRIRRAGIRDGIEPDRIHRELARAHNAHELAIAVAHLEDLRAVLGTWRWLHRWVALLMVLLLLVHVVTAVLHGVFVGGAGL